MITQKNIVPNTNYTNHELIQKYRILDPREKIFHECWVHFDYKLNPNKVQSWIENSFTTNKNIRCPNEDDDFCPCCERLMFNQHLRGLPIQEMKWFKTKCFANRFYLEVDSDGLETMIKDTHPLLTSIEISFRKITRFQVYIALLDRFRGKYSNLRKENNRKGDVIDNICRLGIYSLYEWIQFNEKFQKQMDKIFPPPKHDVIYCMYNHGATRRYFDIKKRRFFHICRDNQCSFLFDEFHKRNC